MSTAWAPKPLRPAAENPLFEMVESPTVVKGLTPIQRQRLADGTPHTVTGLPVGAPPDPVLALPPSMLKKGSLVEKYDERPKQPKQDPEDPMTVVKSYLAKGDIRTKPDGKNPYYDDSRDAWVSPDGKVGPNGPARPAPSGGEVSKSLERMNAAIQDVLDKTGAK